MKCYIGVVEKDPGSAWGIWFPDVPGCTSAADALDDLLPYACQALILHHEDMEAPSARPSEDIMKLQDVRDAFGRGAFLMMVPLLSAEGRTMRVSVTGDACLVDAIDDAARMRGMTRSAFLMQAARHEITRGVEAPQG